MTRQRGRLADVQTRILDAVPPASGAVVMGTGIVSIALLLDHQDPLGHPLGARCRDLGRAGGSSARPRPRRPCTVSRRRPSARRADSIAGSAVLGTRLTLLGWEWAGTGLLIVAVAIWLGLVPQVLGHWQVPTIGASFILTVATESLALLAATLAFGQRAGWLVYASLAPFCLGLAFYAFVLSRFQFRQISVGIGDHWVTGGALAISTVAAGRIALAAQHTGALSGALGALKTIALVLWCVTMAWLPVLVAAEILRPRLRYNVRRWSTVFPVGMYAACSLVVGPLTDTRGITDFGRGWVWVALAVWLVVSGAMLRRAPALLRREQ